MRWTLIRRPRIVRTEAITPLAACFAESVTPARAIRSQRR
jgi:hypothetical protein